MRVREENNLSQWFKFFLVGIIETAKSGIETFDQILQLQKLTDAKIQKLGSRAANAQKVAHYLYKRPVINAEKARDVTGISLPSAYALLKDLEQLKILEEVTGSQRGRIYVYADYLKIFK
jgi:Fic family protein